MLSYICGAVRGKESLNKLLRSVSRANPVLGILTYSNVCSGSCAPCSRDLPSLATLLPGFLKVRGMYYDYFDTPVGRLLLAMDGQGLRHIDFESGRHPTPIGADWERGPGALHEARTQLKAYFADA